MPDTALGVLVVIVAVLPGASFTWALERKVGGWGLRRTDRLLRFITVSIVFHVVLGWGEYALYRHQLQNITTSGTMEVGQFAALWLGTVVLLVVPAIVGATLGWMYKTRSKRHKCLVWLTTRLLGKTPAPSGWDFLFSDEPSCYLRIRTHEGTYIGGKFAADSYASAFPNDADVVIEEAYSIEEDGKFGEPLGYPLYISKAEMAWLEVLYPET